MKYVAFWIAISFLWSCKQMSVQEKKDGNLVKIVLDTEEPLAPTDTIYITGNNFNLGMWNPHGLAMTRRADTRWEKSFEVPDSGRHLEFKFTLGSYEREAISNKGIIPGNSILEVARDTEVYFVIEDFKNPMRPLLLSFGKAEVHLFHPNNGLADRKITVWLPDDYSSSSTLKYPVLYVHDGQNQFDPARGFAGQEWQLDEKIRELVQGNKIQVPIVVAIDNTTNRTQEYGAVTKESPYADFIIHQVKQFIDSAYHTLKDRKHTATMGSSMGGLIALNLAWYHDDIFSKAACLSPAFKVDKFDILSELKKYTGPKKDISLYVDDGTEGIESKLRPGIDETVNYLNSKGYNVFYTVVQDAQHNEAAWAKRIYKPLTMFFGK